MNKGGYSISQTSSIKDPNLPLISIITVVYNGAKFIQSCLDTVRAQSYINLEHIIIDGGSTDGTVDILRDNDHHIAFWLSEADQGIYDAMNKAVNYCSGKWYMFLGVDDLLLDGFRELAYHLVDADTAYYGCVVYGGKPQYSGPVDRFKLIGANICHQALLYPRSVFEDYKYDVAYRIAADNVLLLKLWKDKKFKFEYHEIVISIFNDTGISAHEADQLFFKDRGQLFLEYLGLFPYLNYQYILFSQWAKRKMHRRFNKIKRLFGV